MSSSNLPASIAVDRLIEAAAKPGFNYRKHLDVISIIYVTSRNTYNDLFSVMRRVDKREAQSMESQIKSGCDNVQELHDRQLVSTVYPDAPISKDAIIPNGWALRSQINGEDAIIKLGNGETRARGILSHPIFVSSVMTDLNAGTVMVELVWRFHDGGKWRRKTIQKALFGSKNKLAVELAKWGTSVTANNIGGIIEWLTDFQGANTGVTMSEKTTSTLGWIDDGFLLPNEFIGGEKQVRFVAADEGTKQTGDAVHTMGTMDGWLTAMASIADYPLVITGVYASLSSVLLEIVLQHDGNPIIDWSYRTSTGKTTTLQFAASVWGHMRDMLIGWNGTEQGVIGRALSLCHLPVIVDDTKTARSYGGKSSVTGLIYTLSSGIETARNSTEGLRRANRFRAVVLSTGEDRAIDADKSGGTVARVLSICAPPFGGESDVIKERIRKTKAGLEENYGVAGPAFVRHVIASKARWPEWRERFDDITRNIQERMKGDNRIAPGILDRSAKIIALLQLTAELTHECIPFPWPLPDITVPLTECLTSDTTQTNRELEALQLLIGKLGSAPGRIVSCQLDYENAKGNTDLLGVQDSSDYHTAMFPPSLMREIRNAGFTPSSIIRAWRNNGWLVDVKIDWLKSAGTLAAITNKAAEAAGV